MLILAFDSSEKTASVALAEDSKLIAQTTVCGLSTGHSEKLLPIIEGIMSACEKAYSDIGLFAFSVGPGSFTGVRIGASTLKGLAFGRNIPCAAISSLEAMAYRFTDTDCIVCPVMDARRGTLYNAVFRSKDGVITRLTEDRTIHADRLAEELLEYDEPIYLCGGGYDIAFNATKGNRNIKNTGDERKCESGFGVVLAALNNGTVSDVELVPSYLRPSSAERNKTAVTEKEIKKCQNSKLQ